MPPETEAYLKSHTLSVLLVCAVGIAARYGLFGWAWEHVWSLALAAGAVTIVLRLRRG